MVVLPCRISVVVPPFSKKSLVVEGATGFELLSIDQVVLSEGTRFDVRVLVQGGSGRTGILSLNMMPSYTFASYKKDSFLRAILGHECPRPLSSFRRKKMSIAAARSEPRILEETRYLLSSAAVSLEPKKKES